MRVLGLDLPRQATEGTPVENTLVLLDEQGRVTRSSVVPTLPEVASGVARLAEDEPFLLGVNVPLVVPAKAGRMRPVERLIRRRFGHSMPPGGRSALADQVHGIAGETLMAGLAAAGQPSLPFPDRDLRRPGLAETSPPLILKTLFWEASPLSGVRDHAVREELFRGFAPPEYRTWQLRARSGWAVQAGRLDQALTALDAIDGFDPSCAREALQRSSTREEVERAAGLLDASLIAGTARRYVTAPETCVFVGDQEQGYLILPADAFVRRLVVSGAVEPRGRLFPQASLRERLGSHARIRPADLLSLPGRPERTEAEFRQSPQYEFDNVDEMLWWKHCRHLAGPSLPTEGLAELVVSLDRDADGGSATLLRLSRSRHRTLSFRFEPPAGWRVHLPTRDGKTYPFKVVRAIYETL